MATITRLTTGAQLVRDNPALRAGINEKAGREEQDIRVIAEKKALQISTLDGRYHLINARTGKVEASSASPFAEAPPRFPHMDARRIRS